MNKPCTPAVGAGARPEPAPSKEFAAKDIRVFQSLVERLGKAFAAKSVLDLKELGHDFAELAFLKREPRIVGFSVVAYSLAKFLDKGYVLESPDWRGFSEEASRTLVAIEGFAREGRVAECCAATEELVKKVSALSGKLGRFVMSVVEKARIKAATQVYAHGASLGAAAKFAGVEPREVAKYVGQTLLHEKYATMSVKQRLKEIEKLFA